MITRFEDGSLDPSSLKPVRTASTRTGTCTVGEVTWNAKQKKSRSGRAPHPNHRSMHLIVLSTRFAGSNREVEPVWLNISIQGWSVRVVSGRGIDLCFAIDSAFEPVAARLKPTLGPSTTHRFDGGRRRTHRPAMDRLKSDKIYDIGPPRLWLPSFPSSLHGKYGLFQVLIA